MLIDVGVTIADRREPRRHRCQREVARLTGVDLVPGQWRRDARFRLGPHRIRGRDRAILGVLIVVKEHAVTFFLPPFARGQNRRTTLDLPRKRERGAAHLGERPSGLDADVDVNTARA